MADPRRPPGFLRLAKWLLLGSLLVLMVDLFCVLVLWSPNGSQRLESVLHQELTFLQLQPSQKAFLIDVSRSFHERVFVSTGLDPALRTTIEAGTPSPVFIAILWPVIEAAMLGLQLFALRLGVLILALPFLALIMVMAMADGFSGWYLRRTGGERESGFIYHRAKRGLGWSFLLLGAIYLIPPVPMNPNYLFPPFLLAAGITTRLYVAFFKKFL